MDLSPSRPEVDAGALERLFSGRAVDLRDIFPLLDPADLATTARSIFRKAKENLEERGIDTLFLGFGQATWKHDGPSPASPVVLIPASLIPLAASQNEFRLSLAGEAVVNPVLTHHLRIEHGVDLEDEGLELNGFDSFDGEVVSNFCVELNARCRRVPGFDIQPRTYVLANFAYATMPMVMDLEKSVEHLAANDLIAALAGDAEAEASIREKIADISKELPDLTPPSDEFLVLDADASQNWAINAALNGESIVIEGPPGTGKSQTIANLIASFIARGKRVLFVAEKRAAIEAVTKRLDAVGLQDLVLDLHGGIKNKRELAQLLAQSLRGVGQVPAPSVVELHSDLVQRRRSLNSYVETMHEVREPWGITAYELQSQLIGAEADWRLPIRLDSATVNAMVQDKRRELREVLREWVDLGGPRLSNDVTPWAGASVETPDEALTAYEAAVTLAQESLPEARRRVSQLVEAMGMPFPLSIRAWTERLKLVAEVQSTLDYFQPSLFDLDLESLLPRLQPAGRNPLVRLWAHLTNPEYRQAKRTVGQELRNASSVVLPQLFRLAQAAAVQAETWGSLAMDGGRPRAVEVAGLAEEALNGLHDDLAALGAMVAVGDLQQREASDLQELADRLVADQAWIYRLPRIRELEALLHDAGLGELLNAISERQMSVEAASGSFDYVVAKCLYDRIAARDPRLAGFEGSLHHRRVAEFQELDEEHRETSAARVLRAAAELAVATLDAYPEEYRLIQAQAGRKRGHLPLRRLVMEAPHVLTALRPCWTMSPLLVSEVIPADKTLFDVVIFDEASQVPPAHAVGALGRADQAIVAGDRRQLPPTAFFMSSDAEEEDEEQEQDLASADFESIIDVLLAVPLRPYMLTWHYRSRDERLIAFSNEHLYQRALTTFPGVAGRECLKHYLAEHRPVIGMSTKSNPDEVRLVVDLIIEHAMQHPTESLGVIAMGLHHANNIEDALFRRLQSESSELLEEFLSESAAEPFFVKNLERVQGDERDVIILSVGYGKQADGRLPHRFGPLNQEGGERRLNVAVTRARSRMMVVSSFTAHDIDPNRSSAVGVQLLRNYLAYAAEGGDALGEGRATGAGLNGFELDVFTRLSRAGIPLTPQFGVGGYRIDFAASHPDFPGRMVLAIETDGASYHSSATARDRDRLRQQVLEGRGWQFHRIWSTDWFRNPEAEIQRTVAAYRTAVERADGLENDASHVVPLSSTSRTPAGRFRGPRPFLPAGRPISGYSQAELVALAKWIEADSLLRTESEMLDEMMRELGFSRKGSRIVSALIRAIRLARGEQRS